MNTLYLHIPFCLRKCPYCDFFSSDRHSPQDLEDYVGLLLAQLQLSTDTGLWNGPFDTVFFGGGTPSLLTPDQVVRILEEAARLYGFAADVEISLEANPGTVSAASLRGYHSAGVNRLSLGIQSLQPQLLQRLGRIHSPAAALDALRLARRAGFDNLSCDLIFAQPALSQQQLAADIDRLSDFPVEHLSCYGLTIETGTPFHDREADGLLALPDDNLYAEQFLAIHDRLTRAGFEHYEISNYARHGHRCRHNLGYWQRQSCLAVGAGAHAFDARGWGRRLAVPPDLVGYGQTLEQWRDPLEELEVFDRAGAMAETLYLGLRTADGVDETAFADRFGISLREAFALALKQNSRYLHHRHQHWYFDAEGWLLFDHLILPFLAP